MLMEANEKNIGRIDKDSDQPKVDVLVKAKARRSNESIILSLKKAKNEKYSKTYTSNYFDCTGE